MLSKKSIKELHLPGWMPVMIRSKQIILTFIIFAIQKRAFQKLSTKESSISIFCRLSCIWSDNHSMVEDLVRPLTWLNETSARHQRASSNPTMRAIDIPRLQLKRTANFDFQTVSYTYCIGTKVCSVFLA